jgi:hypothetical protein
MLGGSALCSSDTPISSLQQKTVFLAVLRIHDILVWIRMRILLISALTFKMPTKN